MDIVTYAHAHKFLTVNYVHLCLPLSGRKNIILDIYLLKLWYYAAAIAGNTKW